VRHIADEPYVAGILYSPGGRTILVCGKKPNRLIEWDVESGRQVRQITEGCIGPMILTPDKKHLVSGMFKPDRVVVMELASGRVLASNPIKRFPLYALDVSPDGKTIAVAAGGNEGPLPQIWQWKAGTSKFMDKEHGKSDVVTGVAFSRDGRFLASTIDGRTGQKAYGQLVIWNLATGKIETMLDVDKDQPLGAAYSPDGSLVIAVGRVDIVAWNAGNFKETHRLAARIPGGGKEFTADGKHLVISGKSGMFIWDMEAGIRLRRLNSYQTDWGYLAINRDGTRIATARPRFPANGTELAIWDARTGSQLVKYTHNCEYPKLFGFSPGGELLGFECGGPGGGVRFLDTATLLSKRQLGKYGAVAIDWSADGRWVAASQPQGIGKPVPILVYDLTTSAEPVVFVPNTEGSVISISRDGLFFVWADRFGVMQVWDIPKRKLRWEQRLPGVAQGEPNHSIGSVAVSRDGQLVASGDETGRVLVRRASDGKVVHDIVAHSGGAGRLRFTPDGKYLVSSGGDGRTRFSDLRTMQEVVSFVWAGGEEAVIATPDNYYAATKGALSAVAFSLSGRVYPFEQFDLKLNRPDVVLERLGYAPKNLIAALKLARERRLKKAGFTEEMLGSDFHLPEVKITKSDPQLTKKRDYNFTVRATDSSFPLDRLNVFINGVPIYGSRGLTLKENAGKGSEKSGYVVERKITAPLTAGANRLQVSVLNSKGVESLRDSSEITYDTPPVPADLYVLTVGVSGYAQKDYALQYAAKDATDLSKVFKTSGKGMYAAVHELSLVDADVTREKVLAAKEWLGKAKVDDTVIVFLAGHGLLSSTLEYYFGTVDVDFSQPSERGLAYEAMEDLLDGLDARRKLLMIDTCNSGEADPADAVLVADASKGDARVKVRSVRGLKVAAKGDGGGVASAELLRQVFADLRRGSGAVVLSSAGGYEFALESDQWKNGVFTYSVIEGLTTGVADKNKDGLVEVSELREYVTAKVQELTKGLQTPTTRYENVEYDFPLIKAAKSP
jgi:WD40 repeat protein/uncharacterized caspase-like protein